MAFRKFGGLNYATNNNIVHNTYSNTKNLTVTNQVGASNSNILVQSNLDMSGNSLFDIGETHFETGFITSNAGSLTFDNSSTVSSGMDLNASTGITLRGMDFNNAQGATFRFNTINGGTISMHNQTVSVSTGDLNLNAPIGQTIFIDPLLTVPKITTRPTTDLFISTGSPDGHIRIDRDVNISGNIIQTGNSLFEGNVGITGTLGVTGSSEFNGSVDIRGISTFYGQVGITGVLGVTGASVFDGLFGVKGLSTFNGDVGITGLFGVTGTSVFDGAVGITGHLGITGSSVFNGTVGINGTIGVTGASVFDGQVGVTGLFGVTGTSVFDGAVGITGRFDATGSSTFDGDVGINGLLGVTGASVFNGTLGITGIFNVIGLSTFDGSVNFISAVPTCSFEPTQSAELTNKSYVDRQISSGGDTFQSLDNEWTGTNTFKNTVGIYAPFGVTGTSVFNGSVGVTGFVGVTGASVFNGSVGVTGLFGVTGASVFNGTVGITGQFGVTGASVFNGSVGVTGLFGVTGASVFNGSAGVTGLFGVTGASVFNGQVGVTGLFGVTGASVFNGQVGVTGLFGVTGASVFNGQVGITGLFGVTGGSVFDGQVGITGLFGVTGFSVFDGQVGVTGLFGVTGGSVFDGQVGVTGLFGVTGFSVFDGQVGVTGLFGVTGFSVFDGQVGVTGLFGVTGRSVFDGQVGVTGLFGVTGGSVFDGQVGVTGLFGVTGGSVFNGSVGVTGLFGVTGASVFNGSAGVTGLFGVTGASVFNGQVGVTGLFGVTGFSVFDGQVGVTGLFGVTGFSVFDGQVGVTGLFGVTGGSIFDGQVGITGLFGVTGFSVFDGQVGITGLFGVTGVSTFAGNVIAYNNDNSSVFSVGSGNTYNKLTIDSVGNLSTSGYVDINGKNQYLQFPDGTRQTTAYKNVQVVNQPVYGQTRKKNSITYNKPVSIKSSEIITSIDSFVSIQQSYSFGKNIRNVWVAGGASTSNTLAYSYDGINWIGLGTSIFSVACYGIKWNGTMWVACGGGTNNNLAYSYDGINWVGLGNVNSNGNFYGIEWNGTMWVAGGFNSLGNMVYSYDGIIWISIATPFGFSTVACVAWNGLMWLAGSNSATNTMGYSYDGINWFGLGNSMVGAETSPFTIECRDIKWNGQMWVAVGNSQNNLNISTGSTAYSYDGINWSNGSNIFSNSSAPYGVSVEWNGQLWVACGNGNADTLAYSYDGIAWTGLGKTVFSNISRWVKWNGTMWIACGTSVNDSSMAYSYDGIRWTKIKSSANLFVDGRCVAFNGTRPHTITFPSNNILIGSADNQALMKVSNPNTLPPSTTIDASQNLGTVLSPCNCVTWNGSMWVAIGAPATTQYSIATSIDGVLWTGLDADNTIFSVGYAVAWNGTMWVAVGTSNAANCSIARSYDGYTWISVDQNANYFMSGNDIAYNDTMWVAVGTSETNKGTNSIAYSYDGITWTGLGTEIAAKGNAVAWNGYMWVAGFTNDVSYNNTLAYSFDGITWIELGNDIFSAACLTLDWNGQMWVAGGEGTNTIAYSHDGINWNADCTMDQALTTAGYGIAGNNNQFVTVGAGTNTCASTSSSNSNGARYTNLYGIGNNIITNYGRGVAYNNNLDGLVSHWVAVGNGAYPITYSSDGYAWQGATFTTGATFSIGYGVASNNDSARGYEKFIAVGSDGTCAIAGSPDGINWVDQNYVSSSIQSGYGVACNNAIFSSETGATGIKWVVVGKSNISLNSPIAYAKITVGSVSFTKNYFGLRDAFGVDYNKNTQLWVVVGNSNSVSTTNLSYSRDGRTWSFATGETFSKRGNAVAANNTSNGNYKFVAVGQGNNTSSKTILVTNNGVAWSGSTFSSAGSDGNSFIAGNCIACNNYENDETYNSIKWIAGGTGNTPLIVGKYSLTWTNSTISKVNFIYGIGCNPTATGSIVKWVAAGSTFGYYTANSNTWSTSTSNLAGFAGRCVASDATNAISGTTYRSSRWVAGGTGGSGVISSADGKGWTGMECANTEYNTSTPIINVQSVACNPNAASGAVKWVAVGDGSANIISGREIFSWYNSANLSSFTGINGIVYGNSKYVTVGAAAGTQPLIQSSSSILSGYTTVTLPSSKNMTVANAVAINAGDGTTKYVVVGSGNASTNGIVPILELNSTPAVISNGLMQASSTYLSADGWDYTIGNCVACNPNAGLGDVKWIIGGAGTKKTKYIGRFSSQWTNNPVTGTNLTTINDVAHCRFYRSLLPPSIINRCVIVGNSSTIYYSNSPFTSWTAADMNATSTTTRTFNCITSYTGNNTILAPNGTEALYLAGCSNDSANYSIFFSENGAEWFPSSGTTGGLYGNNAICNAIACDNSRTADNYWIWVVAGSVNGRVRMQCSTNVITPISGNPQLSFTESTLPVASGSSTTYFTAINGVAVNTSNHIWVAVGVVNNTTYIPITNSSNPNTDSFNQLLATSSPNFYLRDIRAIASNNSTDQTSAIWVVVGATANGTHTIGYTLSSNGYTSSGSGWTSIPNTNKFFTNGSAIVHNGTMWVASGTVSSITTLHFAFSYNGMNWFSLGNFYSSLISCNSINYSSQISQMFAVGVYNGAPKMLLGDMGTNATAWSATSPDTSPLNSYECIVFNPTQSLWVVVGKCQTIGPFITNQPIQYSTDGLTWTDPTFVNASTNSLRDAYGLALDPTAGATVSWVAVGSAMSGGTCSIAYSTNGTSWTGVVNSKYLSNNFKSVAFNGAYWIAMTSDTPSKYAYSSNGTQWFAANVNNNIAGKFITIGGGGAPIVVGSGSGSAYNIAYGVYSSVAYPQFSWSDFHTIATPINFPTSVAYNQHTTPKWVAVGNGSYHYSTDGISWTSAVFSPAGTYSAIATNGTGTSSIANWVAVGTSGIAYSLNGSSWIAVPKSASLIPRCVSIAWDGQQWIAAASGAGCSIAYSKNGNQWFHSGISNRLGNLRSMASDGANNVFTGGNSPYLVSGTPGTNEITWYPTSTDLSGNQFVGVACNNGVASNTTTVKWGAVTKSGGAFFSYNGLQWTPVLPLTYPPPPFNFCYSIACNSDQANPLWVMTGTGNANGKAAYSTNFTSWTIITNSNTFGTCFGVTYATGKLWCIISGNGYATSIDGISWTFSSNNIFDLSYNNIGTDGNNFLAVGKDSISSGTAYSSDNDLLTWSNSSVINVNNSTFYGVACDNTNPNTARWVAVGTKIVTSTDGNNWTISTNQSTISTSYGVACRPNSNNAIAYWVAVGTGPYSIVYCTSANGNTWLGVNNSNDYFTTGRAVTWTGSLWVATGDGGKIAYSTDGIAWSAYNYNLISGLADNFSNYISSVKWTGFYWIASGLKNTTSNGCLLYSIDGKYWTETLESKFLTYINSLNTIGWTSNLSNINIKHPIVAVGTGTSSIAYSMDGYKWVGVGSNIFQTGHAVAWNGSIWVAVGEGTNSIAYSYDGLSWVSVNTGSAILSAGYSVAWNGTIWLAGGNNLSNQNVLAFSYDGVNWYTADIHPSLALNNALTQCNAIAWNGNVWCAGGDASLNYIATSPDGFIWTPQTQPYITNVTDIKSNGQIWVAAGTSDTSGIIYSYNGTDWVSTGIPQTVFKIAWNGKMWVASSADTIYNSVDGISWTNIGNGFSTNAVAWAGDKWIVGTNALDVYDYTGATRTKIGNTVTLTYTTNAGPNSPAQPAGTFHVYDPSHISNLNVLLVSGGGGGGYGSGYVSSGGGGGNVVNNTNLVIASNTNVNVNVGCGGAGATSETLAQTGTVSSLNVTYGSLTGILTATNSGYCGSNNASQDPNPVTTDTSARNVCIGAGAGGGGGAITSFVIGQTCVGGSGNGTGGDGGDATTNNNANFYAQLSAGGGGGGSGATAAANITDGSAKGNGGAGTFVSWTNSFYGGGGGAEHHLIGTGFITTFGDGGAGGGGNGSYTGFGINGTSSLGGGGGAGLSGGGNGGNGSVIIQFTEITANNIFFETSYDGTSWNAVRQASFTTINGIAGNPRIGVTSVDSQIALNAGGPGLNNTLDVVSGSYYQSGYTNMETSYTTNL